MLVAKFSYTHDCILGNRCKKFNVILQTIYLGHEIKNKRIYVSGFHHLSGKKEDIKKFVNSLKKEKTITKIELNNNALFTTDWTKDKPSEFFNPNMFMIKPVLIDEKGYEHWELASFDRKLINKFLEDIQTHVLGFELYSIRQEKLDDIYFPKVMPALTNLQKKAIELAIREGYYNVPKDTSLRKLAKRFGCALATYQKHLQIAERKIIPDAISHTN